MFLNIRTPKGRHIGDTKAAKKGEKKATFKEGGKTISLIQAGRFLVSFVKFLTYLCVAEIIMASSGRYPFPEQKRNHVR